MMMSFVAIGQLRAEGDRKAGGDGLSRRLERVLHDALYYCAHVTVAYAWNLIMGSVQV